MVAVYITLALFGLFDIALWALAIYLWWRHVRFMARAVTIEGRVVDIRTSRAGESGVGSAGGVAECGERRFHAAEGGELRLRFCLVRCQSRFHRRRLRRH